MRKLALGSALLLATMIPAVSQAVPFWGASASRPPETAPVDLQPGEFVWNPAAAGIGPILVLVSLGEQRAYVYRNGVEIGVTTISSGKPGHGTPTACPATRRRMAAFTCHRSSRRNCSLSRRWE